MQNNLAKYAGISTQGAILMGEHTVVDGHYAGREIGIFIHIHSDHTKYFTQALHECNQIYMSPPTFDLLAALQNDDYNVSAEAYFSGRHIHRLEFETPLRPKRRIGSPDSIRYADKITLFQAQHILGSAQVLAETNDGKRIAYFSDFAYPDTKPIKCDVLILDSTHDSPKFDALVNAPSLENRLVEFIDREIQDGNSICIRAHLGRLQYIMSLLSGKFRDVPFLTGDKDARIARVYNKYGFDIKELVLYDTIDADLLMARSAPFIEFKAVSASKSIAEIEDRSAVFYLGGYFLGNQTVIKMPDDGSKRYNLDLADHASYSQILEYVKGCNPELVITDSYRSKYCVDLANNITEKLGIDAMHQPS